MLITRRSINMRPGRRLAIVKDIRGARLDLAGVMTGK
ncbi:hypothetical protein PS928_06384 [Pseudomonas fluorescens]|uniref:Uncharacterized protein n=1 Tax=Pseudomonas fluorescens TaxID=294 RepID=A0A5E7VTF3_PSEFL|nr:hypothetical protein PS928_06384 [Pseudomonas fluorescens]